MKLQLDCLLHMSKVLKFLKNNQEEEEEDHEFTLSIFERAYDVKILQNIKLNL